MGRTWSSRSLCSVHVFKDWDPKAQSPLRLLGPITGEGL